MPRDLHAAVLPAAAAALLALGAALALDRSAPPPAADVSRGSEDAFADGLQAREIPPRGTPQRWTRARARFAFRHLPAGPATVTVRAHGHRGPVAVAVDGVVAGTLVPGQREATFRIADGRPVREVVLQASPFASGGRELGTMLDRVEVRPDAPGGPAWGLLAAIALAAGVAAASAALAGLAPSRAALAGVLVAAVACALLRPDGVARSPYASRLCLLLAGCALVAGAWGTWWARRAPGAGPWAFGSLLLALVVQVVLGASPVMVVSDAVFHANNLGRVVAGDLFLTSVTQHARPFRFPYGVSFYVLLAPLARAGVDPVALVRWGASLSGVAAAAALFALGAARRPAQAGLAVVALQLLPGTFDALSFGNLSNVFAQAVTVLFFAWWAGRAPGGWPAGALLCFVAATAHFSAFVVLAVLGIVLVVALWRDAEGDRRRALAVAAGLLLAAAYYASFAGLVLSQLARLGEGGGAAGEGFVASLWRQLASVSGQWALPAVLLAAWGRPRLADGPPARDEIAWWLAGALLGALALVSPLDVRWVYALTAVVALAAARGLRRLWSAGLAGRVAAGFLAAAQAALWLPAVAEALWQRYR